MKGKSAFEVSSMMQGPNETFVTIKVVIPFVMLLFVSTINRLSFKLTLIMSIGIFHFCWFFFFAMIVENKHCHTFRSSMEIVGLFNLLKSKDNLLLEPLSLIGWNK